jgi:hypothetical protein
MILVHAIISALLLSSVAAVSHGVSCTAVEDPNRRLSCYDAIAGCAEVVASSDRLACYDAAAVPEGVPRPSKPATQLQREPFPVRGRLDRGDEPVRVAALVVSVNRDSRGRRLIALDNGQVWRELSAGRMPIDAGTAIELSHGIMGSVNLQTRGSATFVKVRRIE